jgi:plastocyanin
MTARPRIHHLAVAAVLAAAGFGACGDSDTEKPSGNDAVTIQDFTFKPGELAVEAGTTVTFTNKDGFAHTATAEDKTFDSGSLAGGASFEHTFDEAGTYAFHCAIHNSMTGTITVS